MRKLLLLMCFCLMPMMATGQSDDRDTLTAFLEDNLSSDDRTVTVTGFRGAFSSRAQIDTLTIADGSGVWLTLTGIVLDWNRLALLSGIVDITELTATEVVISRAPIATQTSASPESSGFSVPELPVSVSIKKLEAARLVLGEALLGQAVEASLTAKVSLADGQGRVELQALRGGDGPDGRVLLTAAYNNETKLLEVDLDAAEGAGGIAATLLDVPGAPQTALQIKGSGPLQDFAADILLQTDGETRLAGTVSLAGIEGDTQQFDVTLAGNVTPLFLPDYAEFFGSDVRLQAMGLRREQGQIELSALVLNTRALVLTGEAAIAADGLPERVNLTGRLALPSGEAVLLPLSGGIETRVNSADLQINFDTAKGDGWSGAVIVTGLDRADLQLGRAALTGSGRLNRGAAVANDTVLDALITFEASDVRPHDTALAEAIGSDVTGRAMMTWQPDSDGLQVSQLSLDGADYGVSLAGRIGDLTGGFAVTGKVEARYDALARLSGLAGRPLSGSARIAASGTGSILGGDIDAEAKITGEDIAIGQAELDALLQGQATIALAVKRDETGTALRSLELTVQQLRATATGTIASGGSDIRADLNFNDLAVLGPAYSGALQAKAAFLGTPSSGKLTLDGIGQSLKIGQTQADAALAGESRLSFAVGLADGRYDIETLTISNPQITASGHGHYANAGSDLQADIALSDLAPLGQGYKGALAASLRATGTIMDGRLELTGKGQNLALGKPEADKLLAGNSTMSAVVNIKEKALVIEAAEISNPQVVLSLTGAVSETLRQVTLDGRLANLALLVPDFPGSLLISGTAKEDATGFVLDLTGKGPGGVDATVTGRLDPGLTRGNLAIKGVAQAALANVFLGNRSISGQTRFDLSVNGPLALSSVSGNVSLSDGRLSAADLPFGLQNIAANARLGGASAQLDLTADATTGGRLSMNGSVGLVSPNTGDLKLAIRGLELRDPDLFKTVLDGNVSITGPLTGGALIAGDLQVGETELRVPTSGFSETGAIEDLQHVNEPAAVRDTRAKAGLLGAGQEGAGGSARPFRFDLRVDAPSRIFLRGRGLDVELGGQVRLEGNSNTVITSGAINLIRGRLDILGKRLELQEATLELLGNLVPHLTVLASNEGDEVTSYVEITGRADDPQVRFYSVPDLPQEEVLAQLLFGRGLTNISAFQAVQLASAVATLAGKGGEGIVGNLRKSFGLDDLDVSTDADGNSALKAGKYISENVYSEVEVDQQGQSTINLNLDISKSAKIRGSVSSAGETGIGIFVERDY
jgi:translocation and assembly module TamB